MSLSSVAFRFRVDNPVSANRLYATTRGGGMYKQRDAKAYQERVAWAAKAAARRASWEDNGGMFSLNMFYSPRSRGGPRDLDNLIKLTQDGIADGLGFNDSRVSSLSVVRCVPDGNQDYLVVVVLQNHNYPLSNMSANDASYQALIRWGGE